MYLPVSLLLLLLPPPTVVFHQQKLLLVIKQLPNYALKGAIRCLKDHLIGNSGSVSGFHPSEAVAEAWKATLRLWQVDGVWVFVQ